MSHPRSPFLHYFYSFYSLDSMGFIFRPGVCFCFCFSSSSGAFILIFVLANLSFEENIFFFDIRFRLVWGENAGCLKSKNQEGLTRWYCYTYYNGVNSGNTSYSYIYSYTRRPTKYYWGQTVLLASFNIWALQVSIFSFEPKRVFFSSMFLRWSSRSRG